MTTARAPRRARFGAALIGGLMLAACSAAPAPQLVKIIEDGQASAYFEPSSLEISVGTEVRWRNSGSRVQAVMMDALHSPQGTDTWESGPLRAGETFSHRFETPGTYLYRSGSDDTGLVGTIEVRE